MPFTPPIRVKPSEFGEEDYKDLCKYIEEQVEHLDRRLMTFRSETLPEYVRLYKGRPKNKKVDWPWEGAANLVIPLIGTFSDELLSRVMGSIWMYEPLWTADIVADGPDKQGEDLKEIWQTFLQDEAYDRNSLDLYRVEQGMFKSTIVNGTGVMHFPYEYQQEVQMVYVGGGETAGKDPEGAESNVVVHDGPHPEMIPLNRWGFDPNCPNLQNMEFFYHIDTLNYWQFKNLPGKNPYFKTSDIDELLNQPDALQEDEVELALNEGRRIDIGGADTGAARWKIYRCNLTYQKGPQVFRLQAAYHKKSKKVFFVTYNQYPKNMRPYEDAKLAYDEESYLGFGFAEMTHAFQKELSNNVNWRTNNRNYAMLGAWRVSPESKLSSILDIFPGVAIPAKKDELEYIKAGTDVGYNNAPDEFVQACAKERTGVDPATGGTGGGIVNAKRGIYSAAGTSMVLTQQNNRNSLRASDMRSAHVSIGEKLGIIYANFGIGDRLKKYGDRKETLKRALDAVKNGTLGLKVRATTAAMNKELERQNDILLSDRTERFYQAQAQQIEAILNPGAPPEFKQYMAESLLAGRVMMQGLLRAFGKNNVDAYLPQVKQFIQLASGPQPSPGGAAGAGNAGNAQTGGLNSVPRLPSGVMAGGALPTGPESSI